MRKRSPTEGGAPKKIYQKKNQVQISATVPNPESVSEGKSMQAQSRLTDFVAQLSQELYLTEKEVGQFCWLKINLINDKQSKVGTLDEDSLRCSCSPYGEVKRVLMARDGSYAFVKMADILQATKIRQALNGRYVDHFYIQVRFFASPELISHIKSMAEPSVLEESLSRIQSNQSILKAGKVSPVRQSRTVEES